MSNNSLVTHMPPCYQEWLRHVFDCPSPCFFDLEDVDFKANSAEIVALVTHTLENCKIDLAGFSDAQVGDGLTFIFSNTFSDIVFALKDQAVPVENRLKVIEAIKTLYRDCFAVRCTGHELEPLDSICYMLWDISPIARWERDPHRETFYRAVVNVMDFALTLQNPVCIESALHGLGHTHSYYPEGVTEVISSFLQKNPNLCPQLKSYAGQAIIGYVQ